MKNHLEGRGRPSLVIASLTMAREHEDLCARRAGSLPSNWEKEKKNNVSIKYSASLLSEISNIKMGANLLPGAMIKMPLFPAK